MSKDIAHAIVRGNSFCSFPVELAIAIVPNMDTDRTARLRRAHLTDLVNEKGSQAAVADLLDVTPGYLNQLMLGRRNIGEKTARKIELAAKKPPGWLDQPHDTQLPDAIENTSPGPNIRGHVPLISWVQAGAWAEAEDPFEPGEGEDFLPCPASHGLHTYALRVEGDSMTAPYGRSYPAGVIIFIDPDQRGGVASGERVVAKVEGEPKVTFKVFIEDGGRRYLKPLNPQYPVIDDPFRILGKVIGAWMPE